MNANFEGMAKAVPRQWIKTVAATNTPESFGRRSISALSRSGLVATATSTAHGLKVGDRVDISGATQTDFNVTDARVMTVADANTFTYNLLQAGVSTPAVASGTIVAICHVLFRKAVLLGKKAARTDNTGSVYFGAEATDDSQPHEIVPSGENKIEAAAGAYTDLADWYLDVATAADGIVATLT